MGTQRNHFILGQSMLYICVCAKCLDRCGCKTDSGRPDFRPDCRALEKRSALISGRTWNSVPRACKYTL